MDQPTPAIDAAFDFRTDAKGRDPDFASPTLRRYHKALWRKPLPSGALFALSDTSPGGYLHHRSAIGEFWLSSDSVIPTFTGWPAMHPIVSHMPDAMNEEFLRVGYTIGGFLLWPGNRLNGKWTINQARGCLRRISDRMDLTLECIRRHYLGQDSPLAETLTRYADFFALFEDFRGYVDFWLLQDLVTQDYSTVQFFMPFDAFNPPHAPRDIPTYLQYRSRSIRFAELRSQRMSKVGVHQAG